MLQQVFAGLGDSLILDLAAQVRKPRARRDWLLGLSAEPQRVHCERFAGKTQWFSRARSQEVRHDSAVSQGKYNDEVSS